MTGATEYGVEPAKNIHSYADGHRWVGDCPKNRMEAPSTGDAMIRINKVPMRFEWSMEKIKHIRWVMSTEGFVLLPSTSCPDCGGPWKMVAAILEPGAVRTLLSYLRLPTGRQVVGRLPGRLPSQLLTWT